MATNALIGGSLSPEQRDTVVFIRANHTDGTFADCTGTLVTPHVVITAKHCVTLIQAGEFVCTGSGTLVENGQGAGLFGAKVDGSKIEIYTGTAPVGAPAAHGLSVFVSESSDACHDDVAALVLDTKIEQPAYPMLRSTPVVVGETVMLVGYGTVGHEALVERREISGVRVNDVGSVDGGLNPRATVPPRSFVVAGGTACFGDSGGPAFSMTNGALTGVYSRITGDCSAVESRNTFMLASSFISLFDHAFEVAGEQPQAETVPSTPVESTDSGASGGSPAATGGASSTMTATAGSSAVMTPEVPVRQGALRCSLAQTDTGVSHKVALWFGLALTVALTRRRCGGHSF